MIDDTTMMDSDSETITIADSDCLDVSDSNIFTDDSDDSETPLHGIKRVKRSECEDDSDGEEGASHRSSEKWIWQTATNSPKVWNYRQTPGIKATVLDSFDKNNTKLDVFYAIFDDVFWENVATETNRYAEQLISDENRKRKIDEAWTPVTCDEIKSFCALCIIMTQVRKSSIQMYWSKRAVIETPIFNKIIPIRRFLRIARFLHFGSDVATDGTDLLCKLKPVINFFNDKFKEIYTLERDVCINESSVRFKVRSLHKRSGTSEGSRCDIKIYKLCESVSSYCYHFKITASKGKISRKDITDENIVMELSESILNKGHTLYLANWTSSPKLFSSLVQNETNVIGTMLPCRNNMPTNFVETTLKQGECLTRCSNGLLLLKWNNKQDVYIISTKHETAELTDQGGTRFDNFLKPKCVIEYNRGMIGADRQDQILACFPIMRKLVKSYRKIFFYMFDVALFNTYILYKKINRETPQSYFEYRIDIAELLLQTVLLPDYKGRSANTNTPFRLQAQHWAHFPKHIDPTVSKQKPTRACKVCSKNKKRSETSWECKMCKVALHVPYCFEQFHTVENY